MESFLFAAQIFTTLFMVGLIWMVQVVHYPMFADIPKEAFPAYAKKHASRITAIVMPAMLIELFSFVYLGWVNFLHPPIWFWWGSGIALALAWLITFLVSVPCHTLLQAGFDPKIHRKLVATNWTRTFAWTTKGCLLLWVLMKLAFSPTV